MIDFDTPSSNFIIHLPDDNGINLVSDWFSYKEVSIKGQNFLFLSLLNDNLMSSKELSDKIQIDIQDFIPLGPQGPRKFDQKFNITGYNQKDFKFNEYKAFLRQISSNIKVYDNISVIEVNAENCQEDIDCLSTFLPFLYPYLSFASYLPKNRIRIFIINRNGYLHTVTKSDILSLLNWENLINQIYFNSNKSIADIVLNEEGEKYYKRLFQDKVITTDNYIFTICKFANISKINKYKSLELKVQSFPSNFTLEKAYQFFSDYQHIYRIQIFNENDMKTSVIIQFTSKRSYKRLLGQTTLRYQSKNVTIKPSHETATKSDNNNEEEENSEVTKTSENRQISPLKTRNFIDDDGNDDTFLADKQLNTENEVKNITSHHSSRDFIDDVDEEDDHKLILKITSSSCDEFSVSNSFEIDSEVTKSDVVERGINLHLVKDINSGNRSRRNHLFISDSYSENDDNDEDDRSLNNIKNRKYFSSSRFSNDSILSKSGNYEYDNSSFKSADKASFVKDVSESISKTNKPKSDRLYISDEENEFDVDENLKDKDNSMKCDMKNATKKFVVLERGIDDIGSYSYSEAYTEYGSCSDSD